MKKLLRFSTGKLLLSCFLFMLFTSIFGTDSYAQCPSQAVEIGNDKAFTLVWGTPPDPLPASIVDEGTGTTYNYDSGAGTSGDPACYRSGPNCNGGVTNFTGTLTVDSETCAYSAGSLPIELSTFTSSLYQNQIVLDWTTTVEINNDGFSIEKSADGFQWTELSWVEGAGNTLERQAYRYVDSSPFNGNNYYRLKQVDFDGSQHYSNILSIKYGDRDGSAVIFPNPVKLGQSIFLGDKPIESVEFFDS
ncbi:MAG: hypothetical protein AAFZ15_06480 [Bacteroidota bacterium]